MKLLAALAEQGLWYSQIAQQMSSVPGFSRRSDDSVRSKIQAMRRLGGIVAPAPPSVRPNDEESITAKTLWAVGDPRRWSAKIQRNRAAWFAEVEAA